jgi:phage shock protein A
MSTLSHVVEVVKTKLDHALDHLEDPQETYEFALSRQKEMLDDVRNRLSEIAAERSQTSGAQTRLRLDDEQHRLTELEAALQDRIAEFEHLLTTFETGHATDTTQVTVDRAVAECERADTELRHCTDW